MGGGFMPLGGGGPPPPYFFFLAFQYFFCTPRERFALDEAVADADALRLLGAAVLKAYVLPTSIVN